MVYRESSQAVFLIALRAPTESPFGSRDTYIFDLILPPLGRILRLAAELGMLRNLTEDMTDVLRMCPGAVIIVTDDLRPVFLNPPAQSLLARSDGLALIHDTLTTTSSRQAAQLRQLIAERGNHDEEVQTAAPGAFARRILIDRPSGAPPLVLHVERLPHPVSDGTGRIRSAAVVFAGNPNGDGTLDLLRRHYGMTPTEARLAGLIANGHTLSHAAANMNISHNTARTHMKRVYAKTDTRRQADLVRLLGSDSVAMRGSRH
jgi:DNA-binding CsgD family transcriptional regulator